MQAHLEFFGMAITFATQPSSRAHKQATRPPTEWEIRRLMEESTAAAVLTGSWQGRNAAEHRESDARQVDPETTT